MSAFKHHDLNGPSVFTHADIGWNAQQGVARDGGGERMTVGRQGANGVDTVLDFQGRRDEGTLPLRRRGTPSVHGPDDRPVLLIETE